MIKINLISALEKGEEEPAIKRWNVLSELAKVELIAKPKVNSFPSTFS